MQRYFSKKLITGPAKLTSQELEKRRQAIEAKRVNQIDDLGLIEIMHDDLVENAEKSGAFKKLWEKYECKIRAIIWKILSGPRIVEQTKEEALQDFLILAYRGFCSGGYRPEREDAVTVYSWLKIIATSVSIRQLKRQKKEWKRQRVSIVPSMADENEDRIISVQDDDHRLAESQEERGDNSEEALMKKEKTTVVEKLHEANDFLSTQEKEILDLWLKDELGFDKIAERIGRKRHESGRDFIKAILEKLRATYFLKRKREDATIAIKGIRSKETRKVARGFYLGGRSVEALMQELGEKKETIENRIAIARRILSLKCEELLRADEEPVKAK